jgi:hypothetical protein
MSDNEAHNLLVRVWNSKWVELPPPLKGHIEAYLNRQTRTHDQGVTWCDEHDWLASIYLGDLQDVVAERCRNCTAIKWNGEVFADAWNALAAVAIAHAALTASQPATDGLRALAEEVAVRIRGDAGFSPLYTNYDGATLEDQVAQDWLRRYDALNASQQQAGDAP